MREEGATTTAVAPHGLMSSTEIRTADNIHFGWSLEGRPCPSDSLLIQIPSLEEIIIPIDAIRSVSDELCVLSWTYAEAQYALTQNTRSQIL